jgi:O-antigen/teichoic acid export membrane protein
MLDFGMAVMVGRDLAAAESTASQRYTTWRAAEWVVSLIYASLTVPALLATWYLGGQLGVLEVLACIGLFWALTLQNIGQNALLARRRFAEAAVIQVVGLLARHGLTAIFLIWIAPSLTCFITTQSAVAVVQMLVTRWRCIAELRPCTLERGQLAAMSATGNTLLRAGRSLMLFGLAGAAVMQLDKVIVSGLMSPRELGVYFLATTFCMTPISVLAAPVAQFFQPRLVLSFSSGNRAATQRTLKQFIGAIALCALVPTGLIWLLLEPLVALWLQNVPDVAQVVVYSSVLLPGVAIGALGYVPYTLLIARQDYDFQARYSAVLTLATLTAALFAAMQGSVLVICVVYALYHSVSTIGSWWRCIQLETGGNRFSATGAQIAVITILLVFGGTVCLAVVAAQFNLFR